MTVNWKRRIIRISKDNRDEERAAVLDAVQQGWILDAQAHGDDNTLDLVFRRARAEQARTAWS